MRADRAGESELIPHLVWRDAEARLGLMEEQSRRAIANRWHLTSIMVTQEPEYVSPILLPDHGTVIEPIRGILGPDGQPLS